MSQEGKTAGEGSGDKGKAAAAVVITGITGLVVTLLPLVQSRISDAVKPVTPFDKGTCDLTSFWYKDPFIEDYKRRAAGARWRAVFAGSTDANKAWNLVADFYVREQAHYVEVMYHYTRSQAAEKAIQMRAERKGVMDSVRRGIERLSEEADKLQQAHEAGEISHEQYIEGMSRIQRQKTRLHTTAISKRLFPHD